MRCVNSPSWPKLTSHPSSHSALRIEFQFHFLSPSLATPNSPFKCDALTNPWQTTRQCTAGNIRLFSIWCIFSLATTNLGFVTGPWTTQISPHHFRISKSGTVFFSGKTQTKHSLHTFSCSSFASSVVLCSGPWTWRLAGGYTFVKSRSAFKMVLTFKHICA
jgi:hypothetical protein